MKKIILYILTITAVIVFLNDHLLAQEKRTFNYTDFTEVGVSYGMNITITQGSNYSIEVEANEKDLKVLKVEKKGSDLNFYIDKMNYRKSGDINIKIKMPALTGIALSGGSRGKIIMDVSSKNFSAALSGGSDLQGELTCGDVNLALSGGSTISLKGKAGNLNAAGSGGSIFKFKDFSVKDVDADLSGGSQVTVTMNGRINSDQSGGSQIVYYGNAKMGDTDFSGGSGISKGN